MKKRIIAIIALLVLAITVLSACAEKNYDFVDKNYIYEKLVNGEAFTITINKDGTFVCTDNSSGVTDEGSWSYKDGNLTLTLKYDEDVERVNLFTIQDGNLVYVAEGSTGFSSATFDDGDRFICIS